MKKVGSKLLLTLVLFTILSTSLVIADIVLDVSAEEDSPYGSIGTNGQETNLDLVEKTATQASKNVAEWASNLLENIHAGPTDFSIILLGLLVWMVVFSVIRNIDFFGEGSWIWSGIFSLVVTFLAFRGFPPYFVEGILNQYRGMGATIAATIPFLIILWFTTKSTTSKIAAIFIWLVYIAYNLSLMAYQWGLSNLDLYPFIVQQSFAMLMLVLSILVIVFLGFMRKWIYNEQMVTLKEKGRNRAKKLGVALDMADEIVESAVG